MDDEYQKASDIVGAKVADLSGKIYSDLFTEEEKKDFQFYRIALIRWRQSWNTDSTYEFDLVLTPFDNGE